MKKGYEKYMEKRKMLSGKRIVGIDPAKEKHQATVLDEGGIQRGSSFTFPVSYEGYHEKLWKELRKILGNYNTDDLIFAVETSCNLWKTITDYLLREGYTVLLLNPLTNVCYSVRP